MEDTEPEQVNGLKSNVFTMGGLLGQIFVVLIQSLL
jgi:hypothetical protein